MSTFQEHAAANLATFGWQLPADQIPAWEQIDACFSAMEEWWWGLDDRTRGIIRGCDLSDGMQQAGLFNDFPGMYTLLHGNAYGTFSDTANDVLACFERAHNAVGEEQSPAE